MKRLNSSNCANTPPVGLRRNSLLLALLLSITFGVGQMWADTYEQLTSIANIDESAEYVLGIDGTGFHYSSTSSWGSTALPSAQAPIKYTLKKANDGNSFTAKATISSTTYYLQVPTSNTFSMATSTGTNTDLIIGTTQVSGTNYAVANKTTTARHLRINETSGLRSYAGTTGTMAFFYKVVSAVPRTVSWSVNGNSYTAGNPTTSVNSGSKVTTLPTAPGSALCDGNKVFMGWTSSSINGSTNTKPTDLFTTAAEAPTVSANVTYYAVFADENEEESSKTYELNITADNFNTTSYAANNNEKTSNATATDNSGAKISVKWTSNQVMKNSSNMQWQKSAGYIYNSTDLGTVNSVTITSSAGSFTTYYSTSEQPSSGSSATGKGFFKSSVGSATGTTSSMVVNFTKTQTVTTYSNYVTSCCTPLGSINGSVNMSQNSASLSWSLQDAQNGGLEHITSWKVEYMKDGDADWSVAESTLAKATLTKTITGLTCNSDYSFRVSANVDNGYCAEAYEVSDKKTTQYTITLTGSGTVNGGTFTVKGQKVASVSACDDDNIAIVATRSTGYNFSGWTITNDDDSDADITSTLLTGDKPTTASTSFTMPAENVTVTAAFAAQHHNVVLHKNDGGEDETSNQDFTYGVAQNLNTISTIGWSRANYNFGGWMTDAEGEEANYVDGASYTLNSESNVNLYALWVASNTRTISYSGESHITYSPAKPTTVDIENDDEFSVSFSLDAHYSLNGVVVTMGNTPLDESLISFDQESLTVTAPQGGFTDNISVTYTIVQTTYTVNFYINNDLQAYSSPSGYYGAELPVPSGNALSIDDCSDASLSFVGWTESAIGSTPAQNKPTLVEIGSTITANKNYYAVFAEGTPASTNKLLNETFANERTSDNNTALTSLDNFTITGKVYEGASSTIKFGSSDYRGSITSKELDLSNAFTVRLSAKQFGSDATVIYVRVGDDTRNISTTDSLTSEFKTFTFQFEGTKETTITIGESGKRGYIDDVVVTQEVAANWTKYYTTCPHCNTVTLEKVYGTNPANGSISLGKSEVKTCETATVTIENTPDTGYELSAIALSNNITGASVNDAMTQITILEGAPAGTLTVTSTFAAIDYAVTMTQTGGANAELTGAKNNAHYGETINITAEDKEGYQFLGWEATPTVTFADASALSTSFTMPNEAVEVTAKYAKICTVKFYVGTSESAYATQTPHAGETVDLSSVATPSSFDATNYPNFIGWSATNFGAAVVEPALITGSEIINDDANYYAVFGNALTVETNNYAKVTAIESGKNYLVVAEASDKFYAMKNTVVSSYYIGSDEVAPVSNVITSDAAHKWQIAIPATGKMTIQNASAGYVYMYPGTGNYKDLGLQEEAYQFSYTLTEGKVQLEGISSTYVQFTSNFKNFAAKNEASDLYLYKQIINPTKWATKQIEEVTVSFNDNVVEEEITVPANEVVESGSDLDLSGFTPGARAGYQFSGWSLTTNGVVVSSLSNITEDTPLYAIWAPNPTCTINFSVRGTVKDALQETILQGQTFSGFASKEIAEADEVDGYDFIGWASAAQLSETTNAITPMTSYTPEVEASASEITVYALYKRVSAGTDVTDEITASNLPATTTSYVAFTNKEITSNARYAGATAKGNSAIQLNNNNNPYKGIVVTTSGGAAKKVVVDWNSNTTNERTVNIYGKNSAYSEAGDLFGNASAQGTLLGTIVYGTSTELTIDGIYAYIGIRSASGAMYLDEIAITWSSSTTYYTTRPTQLWAVEYDLDGGEWKSGEGCADGTVQEGEYTVCTDVPVNGEDKLFDKWQINGVDVTTATVNITEATTFTAVWKNRGHGKVTYSANGGVVSGSAPAAADVWENEKVTVVANTFFTNPGYSFGGWDITYNDGENIRTITPDANNQFDMPAYDVTIAAVWSRKSTDKWTRVTSADLLVAGEKYVIANVDATYAMAEQRTNNRGAIAVDQVGDARFITISDNVVQLTLGGNATDGWTFQEGTDYLQATNQDKNYLYKDAANGNYSKWTIAFSVDDNSNPITTVTAKSEGRNILRYNPNNDNPIFSCYASNSSVQNPVNLYMKAPKVDVTTEVDASVITAEGTDVTVKEGGVLNINAEKTVGDVHVENGGQMALTQNLAAHDLYIESKAGQSAQVSGVDKMTLSGNVYIDIQLCNGSLDANYWYSIAVPFDVNLNNGVFLADGTPMVNRVDFEVWGYDTQLRAQTQSNGWKRVTDNMMHAGKAYLIGFNPGQPNIIRLKAAANWKDHLFSGTEMSVVSTSTGTVHDNWNGLANPTMRYIDVDKDAQVFNNNTHGWDTYALDAARYNFVVGTAFFVQSASAVTISNDDHGQYRAPMRENESKCAYAVRITRDEAESFDNQIIVRASEEATGEYTQGHDMLTMNGTSSNSAAMLWTENYGGKRLAIEEAAWLNDQASYALNMYAPKAGTYSISVAETKDNADLYLTQDGAIIWNLSMSAYELSLNKGLTNNYGLLLIKKAPGIATGVDEISGEKAGVQKIVLEDKVFILRGGKMYDVTGKAVK